MANPQHIEWLLEGVDAWNARREMDDFIPDFEGVEISLVLAHAKTLGTHNSSHTKRYNFQRAIFRNADCENVDLSGADFSFADLSQCFFKRAKLGWSNFFEASLEATILRGASLKSSKLNKSNCRNADLRRSDLSLADLTEANFQNAYFGGSDLRGAKLFNTNLENAKLGGANVRTLFLGQSRQRRTSLKTPFLSQPQINSLRGDEGTILPDHLSMPEKWYGVLPSETIDPNQSNETKTSQMERPNGTPPANPQFSKVSRATIAARLETETPVIALTSASLLEQIANYREQIRGDNILAAEHTEFRNGLLDFLDALHIDLKSLLTTLPAPGDSPTPAEVEKTATWTERFIGSAIPEWQKYLAPEALGKATAPAGIILGCGALGAALSGFNPLGFGAGSVVGKWITGELKTGAATDKLAKQMKPDPPEPDGAE